MLSDEFPIELLDAIRDFLTVCREYGIKELSQGEVAPQWWLDLQAKYPPGPDGSGGIAAALELKKTKRVGSGSDKNRMAEGKTQNESDKNRRFRQRTIPRRPSEAMAMDDGSPLRRLDLYESLLTGPEHGDEYDDDDGWIQDGDVDTVYADAIDTDDDDDDDGDDGDGDVDTDSDDAEADEDPRDTEVIDYDDDGAEVEDSAGHLLDGVHGYLVVDRRQQSLSAQAQHRLFELCRVCGEQIPLKWHPRKCEFLRGLPQYWAFLRDCRCNGCLRGPKRKQANQPEHCSDECAIRYRNAKNRSVRRAEGKETRVFDPLADHVADYAISMKHAAQQSKSATGYQSIVSPDRPPAVPVIEPERLILSVPYLHRNARSRSIKGDGGPKRLPLVFRSTVARRESDSWRHTLWPFDSRVDRVYQTQAFPSLTSELGCKSIRTAALVGYWSDLDREMYCGEDPSSNSYEHSNNKRVGDDSIPAATIQEK